MFSSNTNMLVLLISYGATVQLKEIYVRGRWFPIKTTATSP